MGALMVQGTSSSAGKSLITTALARSMHRRGIDVAPFKAQNMSNNARVVKGGEIGTAQYLQALAAGIEPDVLMNPVLVKPEGDNRSQVVVLGKPDLELSRMPWRSRAPLLWPIIERSLRQLQAEHDVLLLEGAGSPAETNLREADLANMRTAEAAGARVVLVADIDRGGAFAHLYGTWAMLPDAERAMISGFVLNKFRGDPALLTPAPEHLARLTGVGTLGVVPWLEHGLPDEDGAATPLDTRGRCSVAVVRYPTASNLDEFKELEQVADVHWSHRIEDIDRGDFVILPGSKHVAADLGWMVSTGIAEALKRRAASGRPVLGICGGLQMLGERIDDEAGVDGSAEGLALLPLRTTFTAAKHTDRIETCFKTLTGPWAVWSEKRVTGYQIRHGRSTETAEVAKALPDGLGFIKDCVLGVYIHGLFEQPDMLTALFGERPRRSLDQAFDELADAIEEHLDVPYLLREAGVR